MSDTTLVKRVKLSAALPSEDTDNGLDYLAQELINNPQGNMVFAVCVLDVLDLNYHVPSDSRVPKMRIKHLEAVLLDEAPPAVRAWLDSRRSERLGAETLPYDDEDEAGLSDPLDDAGLTDAVAVLPHDSDNLVHGPFGGRR